MTTVADNANRRYQASQNGMKYFVKVDDTTILRYKSGVESQLDLVAFSPSELREISGRSDGHEAAS